MVMLKAMSVTAKQHIAGIISIFCAAAMVFSISRMMPYGLSGEIGKAKEWFVLLIIFLVIGIVSGIAYYYFRGKSFQDNVLDRMRIEVDTLSGLGQKRMEPKAPIAASPQSVEGKKNQGPS